jgi:hypothetical protein
MTRRSKARVVIGAVTIVLFVLIIRRVNPAKLRDYVVGVNLFWLIAVLLLNLLNTGVEAVRWRLILSPIKKDIQIRSTFAAILAGVAGNTVFPLRLGDSLRAYVLAKREHVSLATSLGTVMLDRVADVTFFLAMVVVTGFFFDFPPLIRKAGFFVALAVVVGMIVFIALRRFHAHLALRFDGKLGSKVMSQIHRFTMGLSSLKSAGILLPVSLLSALSWAVRLAMVLAIFRAFHLTPDKHMVIASAVFLISVNLGIAAVSSPANLGGFEAAGVLALTYFGVDYDLALSSTLILHMVEVIPMALLGLVVLWLGGVRSSEILKGAESQ